MDIEKSGAKAWKLRLKSKGYIGRLRVKWVKPEHPYTALSPKQEVGANLNALVTS